MRQGVKVGMPLAEARALMADACFAPYEPRADLEALRVLAVWCQRFTPVVAVEESIQQESLLLDITGCSHLFGGEETMARKIVAEVRRAGYAARAAIADTIGAGWAVAHHIAEADPLLTFRARASVRGRETVNSQAIGAVVPPGEQKEALLPLPIEALRLSDHVVQLLHQFDIRRVGELLALPRAALPARFGQEIIERIDQALGHALEVLTPEPFPEPVEASWDFDPPTGDRRMLERAFEHLLEQIAGQLRPRQLGVERLTASLRTLRGEPLSIQIGLLQPSASTPHLMSLVRLHLEHLRVPGEMSSLTVRAPTIAPLAFNQENFARDNETEREQQLPGLIERLSSRLGDKAVLRPMLWPDAQPERACRLESWLRRTNERRGLSPPTCTAGVNPAARPGAALRPACLHARPEAVPVVSFPGGGQPQRFQWQGQTHVVAQAWGPERIETGWWRGRDIRRDYYRVETTTGRRFWLFRDLERGNWFLQGVFA